MPLPELFREVTATSRAVARKSKRTVSGPNRIATLSGPGVAGSSKVPQSSKVASNYTKPLTRAAKAALLAPVITSIEGPASATVNVSIF